jgi:hypothetical protein
MKNSVTCPSCGYQNSYHQTVCIKCNSYIRDKVSNIDLWETIGLLIETPSKAFQKIIYSDHKNFISFIIVLAAIKLLINSRFVAMLSIGEFNTTTGLLFSYLIILVIWIVFLLLFSVLSKPFQRGIEVHSRFKDNLAIITYSQLPIVFALIFFFPIELIVFGDYIFSINPSPFVIKETVAYILAGLECMIILWSMFLFFKAVKVQSNNVIFSLSSLVIFYLALGTLLYFSSLIIFVV